MAKPRPWDDDTRETAIRLFAIATAILEDGIEITLSGQNPRLTVAACVRHAREVRKTAINTAALADAALVTARSHAPSPRKRAPKTDP